MHTTLLSFFLLSSVFFLRLALTVFAGCAALTPLSLSLSLSLHGIMFFAEFLSVCVYRFVYIYVHTNDHFE